MGAREASCPPAFWAPSVRRRRRHALSFFRQSAFHAVSVERDVVPGFR